jgi:hypothetical protein
MRLRIQVRLRRGFVRLDLARAQMWLSPSHCSPLLPAAGPEVAIVPIPTHTRAISNSAYKSYIFNLTIDSFVNWKELDHSTFISDHIV